MLVDGGAAVNIMPYVRLCKLGKNQDDLTKTDMMLKDFEGVVSPALFLKMLSWVLFRDLISPTADSAKALKSSLCLMIFSC